MLYDYIHYTSILHMFWPISEVIRCIFQVTDEGISQLVLGCPNLHYLNLMSCSVSDISISYLARVCTCLIYTSAGYICSGSHTHFVGHGMSLLYLSLICSVRNFAQLRVPMVSLCHFLLHVKLLDDQSIKCSCLCIFCHYIYSLSIIFYLSIGDKLFFCTLIYSN